MENDEVRFQELKRKLNISDGNLASHLRVLENEGYAKVRPVLDGRKHKAYYRLTPKGSKAFLEFCTSMTAILNMYKPKAPRV